jgi:hypothetical protein
VEEEIEELLASNEDQEGVSLGLDDAGSQKICIVQRVLSTQMEEVEK